ncbi:MAG: xanthine dehydrogenase family protein molybdopterin-binding subunit [Alphaproteobacteria bacterium]|nr:xanthine dehydrogenase family protein molybdopterin-binding subunit [Alphaproteobacteria bacterium]
MNHVPTIEPTLKRRAFLGTAVAAGGLSLSVGATTTGAATGDTDLNAYVRITPDNRVSIVMPGCEIGQGVYTGLPKILCEELEADWDKVEVRLAVANEAYANPSKKRQSTGNSDAIIGYFEVLRKTGAQAREMLIAAAASKWKVPAAECRAENGVVHHHASKRSATFGELAEAAAKQPVPAEPKLKAPEQWKLIGKDFIRKDTPAKVDGSADFGADIKLDGLLVATVAASPVFGGQIKHFDEAAALAIKGVVKLVPIDNGSGTGGLAAIAENYFQAKRALEAAKIEWDFKGADNWDSADLSKQLTAALDESGAKPYPAAKRGDVEAALAAAAKKLEAVYEVPYLAHACMEPMSSTTLVTDDACMMWSPTQQQGAARDLVAKLTGLPFDKVTVQNTFSGGGFGRKWELDFTRHAVQVAMAMKGRPVRLYWSREEDIQHDYYRPAVVNRYRAGVDAEGNVTVIHSRNAAQSLLGYQNRPAPIGDPTVVGGAINAGYAVPNILVDFVEKKANVQIGFWRAVAASHNGFFAESLMDEVAALAGKDPLALRKELLKGKPRDLNVLDVLAEKIGWGQKLPAGRGMGIAYTPGFGSILALGATVSVTNGALKVEKIVCVADCGRLIEPSTVIAQLEGGIVYGLTAALFGQITIEKGAVKQSNFTDYPMVTLTNMPELEIHLIPSTEKPGGVGESSVPGVAPAIANAIAAATGLRVRKLPFNAAGLSLA